MIRLLKEIFYAALNVLTLGKGIKRKINGIDIIFPVKYFRFFVKDYEHYNFLIFKQHIKKGDTVIDIGAHIGLYSVIFGKFVGDAGRVYSFEPTPNTFKVLKNTVRLNKLDQRVSLINKAVSSDIGTASFYSSQVGVANSLVSYANTSAHLKITVEKTSVDAFVAGEQLQKVDFVKIDAEGVELEVLKGAKETFMKFHPKVLLALHPDAIKANGDSLEEIYDIVTAFGYQIGLEDKILSCEEFSAKTQLFDVLLQPEVI